jgi:uncharacterized membrane protein
MRQTALEEVKAPRVANTTRLWFMLSALSALSVSNVFVLLAIVSKFEQIYRDALGPDHPLPELTNFVISARIIFAVVTILWPMLGSVLVRQQKPHSMLYLNVGIIWLFLQFVVTIVALFMPMISLDTGLGENK